MNNLSLMSEEDEGRSSSLVEESLENAERVRLIVRGLKAFSDVETVEQEVIDVRALLESAVQLAQNEIRHRAKLVTEFSDIPPINGNAGRLGEAILNVIVNAAQSIEEGNVEENSILLSCRVELNGLIEVVVRDTGCGMSRETKEKVFDPFFTTKPVGVGKGLGLFFCHNVIVNEHGGGIVIASEVDHGTTVRITLPAASGEDRKEASPQTTSGAPVEDRTPRRVLVIDDEPQICRSLPRLLARHEVSTVTSGHAGLEAVEKTSFDVILCDVMMPEMTGRQFYEALSERHPDMTSRVVFMTGGAFTPESKTFLKNLPNTVVEKPFKLAELEQVIAEFSRGD
jgi:CheY-like chemotaxis protein